MAATRCARVGGGRLYRHWDHLGVGRAVLGDAITTARDNATGCALLLRTRPCLVRPERRGRSAPIFLAVTAEEKGLLGSKYYTRNPLVPLDKTRAHTSTSSMILPLGVPDRSLSPGRSGRRLAESRRPGPERLEIRSPTRGPTSASFYRSIFLDGPGGRAGVLGSRRA